MHTAATPTPYFSPLSSIHFPHGHGLPGPMVSLLSGISSRQCSLWNMSLAAFINFVLDDVPVGVSQGVTSTRLSYKLLPVYACYLGGFSLLMVWTLPRPTGRLVLFVYLAGVLLCYECTQFYFFIVLFICSIIRTSTCHLHSVLLLFTFWSTDLWPQGVPRAWAQVSLCTGLKLSKILILFHIFPVLQPHSMCTTEKALWSLGVKPAKGFYRLKMGHFPTSSVTYGWFL
jgi:hypothetical protein